MDKVTLIDSPLGRMSKTELIEELVRLRLKVAEQEEVSARRRQAEAALRESERRFRRIFEDSAIATALAGPDENALDGRYLKVNRALCDLLGYSESELLGMTIADVTHPDDLEPNASLRQDASRGTLDTFRLEKRYVHKNGAVIWADLSVAVIRDDDGKYLYSLGHHQNITERKNAEEMLRLTQFSIDRAGDAVFWIGPDSRLVYVNETSCRLLEYSREELLGMTISEIDPDVPQDSWPRAWQRIRTESPYTFEARHMTRSGAVIPVEVSIYYLKFGDQEMCCSFSRDITIRAKAQEALRHAKEEAERANAAKSRFLVAANHDLRQPLQTLSLNLATLDYLDDVASQQEVTSDMEGALDFMRGLLDTLLDIEKLEEGRIGMDVTVFPIQQLFSRLARDFLPQANAKGLSLRVIPSGLAIRSDANLLERILQNLVSNALRYTTRGKIVVGCRRRGATARIEVWDSGVGIPKHALSTIFEDYYQVDNPARDRRKGLGLGLAIVQRISDLLGHRIDVRSAPARGSVFAVELPLVSSSSRQAPERSARGAVACDLLGTAIMTVEDDRTLFGSTKRLLEAWGAEVVAGASEDQALAEMRRRKARPRLLLVDYRLPRGRTGIEAVQQIRQELNAAVPAIIVTGDMDPDVVLRIEAQDCHAVHKPVRPAQLRALMLELLIGRPAERP